MNKLNRFKLAVSSLMIGAGVLAVPPSAMAERSSASESGLSRTAEKAADSARAALAEEAALAVPGVTNSEGAEAGWSATDIALAASNGFAGHYRRSGHSLSATALLALALLSTASAQEQTWVAVASDGAGLYGAAVGMATREAAEASAIGQCEIGRAHV